MHTAHERLTFEVSELMIDAYDLMRVTRERPAVWRVVESFVSQMDGVLSDLVFDGAHRGLRAEIERVADIAKAFDDGGELCENDLDELGRGLAARCRARLMRLALHA